MPTRPFEQALIVEDSSLFANAVARVLRKHFQVRIARSEDEAFGVVPGLKRLRLALIDLTLGLDGGAGFRVIESVTVARPDIVVAVLSGSDDPQTRASVQRVGVPFMAKPLPKAMFERLCERSLAWPIPWSDVAHHVAACSGAWGLTDAEHRVLCWIVAGRDRESCCSELSITTSTFDYYVKTVRRKANCKQSASELVAVLLRESLSKRTSKSS
jgi:DNA-binding NarL/FixJ family response regulator